MMETTINTSRTKSVSWRWERWQKIGKREELEGKMKREREREREKARIWCKEYEKWETDRDWNEIVKEQSRLRKMEQKRDGKWEEEREGTDLVWSGLIGMLQAAAAATTTSSTKEETRVTATATVTSWPVTVIITQGKTATGEAAKEPTRIETDDPTKRTRTATWWTATIRWIGTTTNQRQQDKGNCCTEGKSE